MISYLIHRDGSVDMFQDKENGQETLCTLSAGEVEELVTDWAVQRGLRYLISLIMMAVFHSQ